MKANTLTLISSQLNRIAKSSLACALFLTAMANTSIEAHPDEWPEMYFQSEYNQTIEFAEPAREFALQSLSCKPSVQVSLSQNGTAVITPGMLLNAPDYSLDQYTVDIMGPLTNTVNCSTIGQEVMAAVTEIPTGNVCMSMLIVEDKLDPILICNDVTIACNEDIQSIDFLSYASVTDNCDPDPDLWYSYTVTPLDCDPAGFAALIAVHFTATDQYGNSAECDLTIYMEKQDLEDVVFPPDTTLSCVDADTDPENTGEPTVFGEPISHFCELIVWHTDNLVPMCSGQYKIRRTWNVMDWCTGMTITDIQEILVVDDIPPVLTCPDDLTIGTVPWDCFGLYTIPQPNATDLCSDDALIDYMITISGNPNQFSPGQSVELDLGDHIITFKATDDCGNSATCTYTVTVVDDDLPVLACHPVSVTLNPQMGMAFINVDSLDIDVFDNCGVASLMIRRMDDNCGVPADLQFGQTVKFCCEDVGEEVMVVIKATDVNGNMITCMVQVVVVDDVPPVAMCQSIMAFLGPDGTVTVDPNDIDNGSTDNCAIDSLWVTPGDFDCDDIGFNVVVLTVSDASGNTATCTANVQVKDTTPPDAVCEDITVMLGDDGMIVILAADIGSGSTDNCGIDTMVLSMDTLDCDDVGTVIVTLIVTDLAGNTSTCTAEVMVADNPPVVECMDATVYLDESGQVIVTADDVDFAADDCSMPEREVIPNMFDCDDIGDNIVILIATDNFGNTSSCTAVVTVIDSIMPECETIDITVYLDDNGMVSIDSNAVDNGSSDNCAVESIDVTSTDFLCGDVGDVVVTQTVTDVNGNTSSCTAIVTVEDTLAPICQTMDITVFLDESGLISIDNDAVDNGSSDNCGVDTITVTPADFDCDDVGDIVVVQTVTDINGNTSTCTATVTVQDTVAPVCSTMDITIYLDDNGMVSVAGDDVNDGSSDNCAVDNITVDPSDFDCDDVGDVVVTQTVTDVNGNTSTCTATITVLDTISPVCITNDITVILDPTGNVSIMGDGVDGGSTDNCAIDNITVDPSDFTCDDVGEVIVTQVVTDVNGNTSSCTAIVTVQDTVAPICQTMDITVFVDEDGLISIDHDAVNNGSSDNCAIDTITVTPSDFDCDDVGVIVVTQTVTDINGNTSTCTASVTVQDTISPICQTTDITVFLDDAGMVSIAGDGVNDGSSDNCAIQDITVTPGDFDCDDIGVVVVTQTVTDVNGNTSTCTASVTVQDTLGPVCQTMDITVFLDESGQVVIDSNAVDNGSSDNCGLTEISVTPSEFDCDQVGVIIVTQTVTDADGNTSTCTASVTVQDTVSPVCQTFDITVFLDEAGEVVIDSNAVDNGSSDNCAIDSISVDIGDFDCDDVGVVVVTQTVTDLSGNTSTCTASITVQDTIAPVCNTTDITVSIGPGGIIILDSIAVDNNSTDACGIVEIDVTPDTLDCDDLGTIVVIQTVTDENGNTSTCSANVTVENNEEPEAICQDITVFVDENGNVSITGADIDGGSFTNCGDITLEADPTDFDCDDIGPNNVTLTVTDGSGNMSTCIAEVTVVDTLAPECNTMDITVFLDDAGVASIDSNGVDDGSTDNCGIVEIDVTPDTYDCDDLGPIVVTQTVTDENGNTSTCTATVTVTDTIAPVCNAMDITVMITGNGMITIDAEDVDDGSSDNCGNVNLSVEPDTWTCDELGEHVVTLTVTDDSGNSTTCTATVTVTDAGNLEAVCQNVTVFLDQNGMVTITPEVIDNGSGGGCGSGDIMLDLDITDFDCTDVGQNIVTLTVTDQMGATSTCTAIVTVVDDIPPMITCPVDATVACQNFNPGNLNQFGTATGSDNCPGFQVNVVNQINVNDCGVGTVTRTFTVTDASGNTASCVQTITVSNTDPFEVGDIVWPPAVFNLPECSNTNPGSIPNSQPVINYNSACAQIGVTFQDSVVMTCDPAPSPPCIQVFRTWIVTDTCQLQMGTQNGIFTFDQVINVNDNTGPVFAPEADISVTANTQTCLGNVNLIVNATACGMGVTDITNDFNGGGANASGMYPVGTTIVTFIATDDCCNTTTLEVEVTVEAPGDAIFDCEKLIVFINDQLEVTLAASDFITFTPGSCTDIEDYFFSYSENDPFDSLNTYGCSVAGDVITFTIYIFDSNLNLISQCLADLDFRDPMNLCGQLVIGGEILDEFNAPMPNAPVFLFGSGMDMMETSDEGLYRFEDLTEGESYTVKPFKNTEMKKGVSTLDLVQIQKHLLGVKKLGTPYKMIAADANNNRNISAIDIVEIRKVILGINTEFTNNSSYRYVKATYNFPDPENPFMEEFPETEFVEGLIEGLPHIDFVSVKTGDVNAKNPVGGDVFTEIRSSEKFVLQLPEMMLEAGEKYTLPITAERFHKLNGFQANLIGKSESIRIEEVVFPETSIFHEGNVALNTFEEGSVAISWHSSAALDLQPETELFSIVITAFEDISVHNSFNLSDVFMQGEAYRDGGEEVEILDVELKSRIAESFAGEIKVFEARPNPFRHQTSVPVYMPEGGDLSISVHNVQGALVHTRRQYVEYGYNNLVFTERDLQGGGIYYLTIVSGNTSETRKIILIR